MAKNKGLGRGLSAIFEDNFYEESKSSDKKTEIPMTLIDTNPSQPRKTFNQDSIAALAESIKENTLLQPILVRKNGERYEIIAGERRFRACTMLGMTEIPAIITAADDLTAAKYALIENLQREDLNPYEEACAYRSLIDDFFLTQEEIAAQVGKSRSAVANSLRLLDLPPEIVSLVNSGTISGGHARALLGLTDKSKMLPLAEKIYINGLSVRGTEEAVKEENRKTVRDISDEKLKDEPVKVDYMKVIEERFTGITGRRCRISEKKGVKTFQLEYRDNSDLEEILKLLAGEHIFDDM
ncbi:MAG: ParB/RepB/Spo0J family partition protein [Eubacteriales bacterium]